MAIRWKFEYSLIFTPKSSVCFSSNFLKMLLLFDMNFKKSVLLGSNSIIRLKWSLLHFFTC